jgi:hypothetical protein
MHCFKKIFQIVTTVTRKMVSITIKQCEQLDCGSYTVKISNKVSEVSADFNLCIKGTQLSTNIVFDHTWSWSNSTLVPQHHPFSPEIAPNHMLF